MCDESSFDKEISPVKIMIISASSNVLRFSTLTIPSVVTSASSNVLRFSTLTVPSVVTSASSNVDDKDDKSTSMYAP